MEYEVIKEFISIPALPDVVAYVFTIICFIGLFFVKQFVKKDNAIVIKKVNSGKNELDKATIALKEANAKHEKEREEWLKDKEELKKEINQLKKAVRVCACNTTDLVKTGTSTEVVKMLPDKGDK